MAGRRWRLHALLAACDKWQRFCRQVNLLGAAECPARGSELGTAQFHAFQPHASAAWRQGSAAPLFLQALSFSSQAKRAGQTTSTAPRPARPPRPASPPRRLTKSGAPAGQPRSKAPSSAAQQAQLARPASPKRPSGGRQGSAARAQPAQTPPLPPKPAPASQPIPTAPPPPIPAPPGLAGSSGSVALPRASQLTTKQAGGATPPASPAPPPGAVKGGSGEVGLDAGGERTPLGVALAGGQQGGGPAAGRASREVQGVGGQPPGPSSRLGISSGPSGLPPPKQLPQAPAPPPPPSPSAWPPPTSLPKPARGDGSREGAPGQSLPPQPRDSSSRGGGGGGGGLADAQLYAVVQGWAGQHARLPPSNPLELIALQADPLHAHPAARRHWVDTFASSVLPLHLPQLQPYLLHPAIGASAAHACLSRWWDSWWRASLPRLQPPLHLLTLSKAAQAGGGGVEGGRQGLYAAQLRSWQSARPDFRQLDALAMKARPRGGMRGGGGGIIGSSSPHHYSQLGLPPSLTQPLELRVWGTATQPGQPSPPPAATTSPQTSLQHQQLRQHQAPVAAAAAGGGGGEGAEARRRRCLLSSWARHPSTLGKLKARSIPDQVLSLTCSPLLTLPPAPSAAGPPPSPSTNFCAWLHAACSWPLLQQLAAYQLDERRNSPGSLLLSDLHLAWLAEHQAQAAASWAQQAALLNLRQPESWYPMARALRRRFIYHAGPTNSGKTYAAMQALAAAQRGVYCGPLRLLALEAYDKLNAAGVRCSLMTGEEVRHLPQASHQACTVEMAPVVTGLDCPALKHLPLESMASHASHLHALLSHMEPGWKLPANATSYSSGGWRAKRAGGPGGKERSLPKASRLDVAVLDEIQEAAAGNPVCLLTVCVALMVAVMGGGGLGGVPAYGGVRIAVGGAALTDTAAAAGLDCGLAGHLMVCRMQMLGDTDRGWAWTRAVLGLPANEIHVCGDDSALQLMMRLCAAMGEPLEVRYTQRFSPLVVQEGGVPGRLTGMQPGDALVAFSRAEIFNYKIVRDGLLSQARLGRGVEVEGVEVEGVEVEVEGVEVKMTRCSNVRAGQAGHHGSRGGLAPHTKAALKEAEEEVEGALEVLGFRVCVVYGALPAETRAAQARLFNDPNSGYDILVASDAIGMGLNLNVRRVVLSTVYKRDTTPGRNGFVLMTDSQIRQIAGRAGRRGTLHSEGYATCLEPSHVPLLKAALERPLAPLQAAGLMPEEEQGLHPPL
ncbi:hypothetical protein V8C86DRAFT_3147252 [Haematococcus lacustris]